LNAKIAVFIYFRRFRAVTQISRANCAEIARDKPRQLAYETFSIKRSFYLLKFRLPCVQRILRTEASNLNIFFKILVFDHSNGSIHARRWRHLTCVNTSYPKSLDLFAVGLQTCTAVEHSLRKRTAIGFRASREH